MDSFNNSIFNERPVNPIDLLKSTIQLIKDLDKRIGKIEKAIKNLQKTLGAQKDDVKQEVSSIVLPFLSVLC